MKRFRLLRTRDVSGLTGVGYVAEGVCFSDGRVALRWLPGLAGTGSTGLYDTLRDVVAIHGHSGSTQVEWMDE